MTPPLLCIAGTLGDGRLFGPMLAALGAAADARAVEHATVEEAAVAILASAPARFVAIGFSLGGFVALALARLAPERVAGLALLSSHARADLPGAVAARHAQLELFDRGGPAAVIDTMWPGCVAPANAARADVKAMLLAMATATRRDRFAAQTALACGRPDARDGLSRAAMPVLALHGIEDRMCPAERAEESAALPPRGALALIPDAGHFAPLEAPGPAAAALGGWLAREVAR